MRKSLVFPERLRKLIASANVTQKQLANAVGVKPQSISQYLDGASCPSYAVLIAIADFFHVSTDYLVGRSDVSTDDMSIAAIGKALGISEKAVSVIAQNSKVVDRLLSHDLSDRFIGTITNYHDCTVGKTTDVYRLLADHEIREASYLLEDIFRAEKEDEAFRKWDVEFLEEEPPPLTDDEIEIPITQDVKNDDILSFLEKALLDEAKRRSKKWRSTKP